MIRNELPAATPQPAIFKRGQPGEYVRISFDIDDTLICGPSVPAEQYVRWWSRWRYPERLRHGARALMKELTRRGCRIWIYTSSNRPAHYLKSWFRSMGIPVEGVINQTLHERTVGRRGPSKYPPAFLIDLHIDDSPGVAMEGADHQFAVLVVSPDDPAWVERVLNEVDARISSNSDWSARRLVSSQSFDVKRILRNCLARISLWGYRIPAYAVGHTRSDPA